jgi:CheY-like chemotaxis protein
MTTTASANCSSATSPQAGARVSAAADAAGARKLLERMDFDLLILDVMMPVEDGFSLAESVRKDVKGADRAADGARPWRRIAFAAFPSARTIMCRSRSSRRS